VSTEAPASARPMALLAAALGTRGLRRLAAGWALASLGSWAFMIALSVYAYEQGGAGAVGLAALARMVPAGLAAPFTGLLGDRFSRRDVLVGLAAARAIVLVLVAVAAGTASLAVVLVLAALFTALQTGHRPAHNALAPLLASSPRQLAAATAVANAVENASFVVGSLVGGVLVGATSVSFGFAATAVAFGLATVVLAFIPRDPVPAHRETPTGAGVAREAVAGFPEVWRDHGLRLVVGTLTATTLVEGAVDVLVVVSALQLLDMGTDGVGWLNAAWGVGGVLGGAVALSMLGRGRLSSGLAAGAVLAGLPLLTVAALPRVPVALAVLVVLGIGYTLIEVAGHSLVQRLASDHLLGRAFGVVETSYHLSTGLGSILASGVIALLGVRGALAVFGGTLLLVAALRWSALARLEAGAAVPEREFALLRGVPFCAPLPIATVEVLARDLVPVSMEAGDDIVREGEPGDHFYVIAEGRVRISVRGDERRVEGPGDFFGEIALLRECPRTATVTALDDGLLMALEREHFLLHITGHARAGGAADAVVAERTDPHPVPTQVAP
jgi:MFS family permease